MNRFSDDIERFLDAQTPVYAEVLQELATGRKTSHWMWFIFPQLRALGAVALPSSLASSRVPKRRPTGRILHLEPDSRNASSLSLLPKMPEALMPSSVGLTN